MIASSSSPRSYGSTCLVIFVMLICGCHASVAPTSTSTTSTTAEFLSNKRLTVDSMNANLKKMEYAVRGKVVIAADKIAEELQSPTDRRVKYDFDHIVYTNIGNPQSVGQKPLTWPRQVMALVDLPDAVGIYHPDAAKLFPSDAMERAKQMKEALNKGGTGAYSHSQGVRQFRHDVAQFLRERDGGLAADPDRIFLLNGASAGIVMMLTALIAGPTCGVMVPIPQYPIYSATIDLLGGQIVGYYLDEKNGWDLNMKELERAFQEAQDKGIQVNSLVLINPGNPTGNVLCKKSLKEVIRFCVKHKLVLLADEVYQENIYDDKAPFVSCKRAAHEAGVLQKDQLELVSFHSTSKGVFGECGRRGGYMELVGIDAQVRDQVYKLASSGLCSCLNGQIMVSLMCRGPNPGDESYESHNREMQQIHESLKRRSKIVGDGLNSIPGFSCQPVKGAMYSFPSVELPQGAIEAAEKQGMASDTLYALSLLERTGICVVPASGFGQQTGRHGFRTTFLPSEEEMERVVNLMRVHHEEFCLKYK